MASQLLHARPLVAMVLAVADMRSIILLVIDPETANLVADTRDYSVSSTRT